MTTGNLFFDAMIKFAILGSAGEVVASLITKRKIELWRVFYSMLVWAALGALVKLMFTGFHAFTDGLIAKGYLPEGHISQAFFKSFFTNAMFGPWIIILHRLLDNLPNRTLSVPTQGLKGAMMTLLWFWIPAHTITFALPLEYQILLAAIWSFVLGLILGFFKRSKPAVA